MIHSSLIGMFVIHFSKKNVGFFATDIYLELLGRPVRCSVSNLQSAPCILVCWAGRSWVLCFPEGDPQSPQRFAAKKISFFNKGLEFKKKCWNVESRSTEACQTPSMCAAVRKDIFNFTILFEYVLLLSWHQLSIFEKKLFRCARTCLFFIFYTCVF